MYMTFPNNPVSTVLVLGILLDIFPLYQGFVLYAKFLSSVSSLLRLVMVWGAISEDILIGEYL